MKIRIISKYLSLFSKIFLIIITGCPVLIYAAMNSTNYKIELDSLNSGGGRGTSVNYIWRDTIGEVSTGISDSASYKLKAGYQQMNETFISISSPSNVTLESSIPGMTGNPGSPASGSASWAIITDSSSGFNLKIHASTDPAMQLEAGEFFNDYSLANAGTPDYTWTSPVAASAEFGFTVEPETVADTMQLFKDDGVNCDAGDNNTADKCWFDFNGLSDIDVINRTSRTDSDGENEVVKFKAESNAKQLKEGNYTATITVTATVN